MILLIGLTVRLAATFSEKDWPLLETIVVFGCIKWAKPSPWAAIPLQLVST
jgi:hypothetical protein